MKDKIKQITDERGNNYGHPKNHFKCTQAMYQAWIDNRELSPDLLPPELEPALKHGIYMICDKLARMAKNPHHRDNLDDIKGYASCIEMVLDEVSKVVK